jgi:hypothetical protein
VILCHSFIRCQEVSDTLTELVTFCSEMVEIVNLDSTDQTEISLKLKKSLANSTDMKSRVFVMTPSVANKIQEQKSLKEMECHSMILDKIDLL